MLASVFPSPFMLGKLDLWGSELLLGSSDHPSDVELPVFRRLLVL